MMQSGVLVFTLYLTSQLVDNDLILIKKKFPTRDNV